jgi:hypothetical protein
MDRKYFLCLGEGSQVMSRIKIAAYAALCIMTTGSATFAQYPEGAESSCKVDYYRNNLWPTPFRAMDTLSVMNVFDQQRNNGWKLYNTVGSSMYDPATNCLTAAGRAHVNWILTQGPQSRRVVFVLQGPTPQATAARVESTQVAVSELVPVGPLPAIYLTDREPAGSSGVYQTAVHRAMVSSVPSPRLPVSGGAAAASGTGSN